MELKTYGIIGSSLIALGFGLIGLMARLGV